MFFKKKKKKKLVDRIVMGIIIGGAVGSVIGLSKNKKAKKFIKDKGEDIYAKGKDIIEDIKDKEE